MNNHYHEKTPLNPNLTKIYPNTVDLNNKLCGLGNATALAINTNTGNSAPTGDDVTGADTQGTGVK